METIFPGWVVARTIPEEVRFGLRAGYYTLSGGVIRGAAGTPQAGQIIRHLVPAVPNIVESSLLPVSAPLNLLNAVSSYSMMSSMVTLTATTQQVLRLATGTMYFSGLSLAVSSVGFITIGQKLKTLEGKLAEIGQNVKEIKALIERQERARLRVALQDLSNMLESGSLQHRDAILRQSRQTLAELHHQYRELLGNSDTVETAVAYEELFSLTALAQVRCSAELGMLDIARRELDEAVSFWQEHTHRIADHMLFADEPERFLQSDFVEAVPSSVLVEWIDFATGEQRGYDWIDVLRRNTRPWYSRKPPNIPRWRSNLEWEMNWVVPTLHKFTARNKVLNGYVAQYDFFGEQNMIPSEFEERVSALDAQQAVEGYFILEPE